MSSKDWRSPDAYEYLRPLDAPGFAWEFLRRNPEFVQERDRLEQAAQQGNLNQAEADEFARRWGVRFRDRAEGYASGGRAVDCRSTSNRSSDDHSPRWCCRSETSITH